MNNTVWVHKKTGKYYIQEVEETCGRNCIANFKYVLLLCGARLGLIRRFSTPTQYRHKAPAQGVSSASHSEGASAQPGAAAAGK